MAVFNSSIFAKVVFAFFATDAAALSSVAFQNPTDALSVTGQNPKFTHTKDDKNLTVYYLTNSFRFGAENNSASMHFGRWFRLAHFIHQRHTTNWFRFRFGANPSPARKALKAADPDAVKSLEKKYKKLDTCGGRANVKAKALTKWFQALTSVASNDQTGAIWNAFDTKYDELKPQGN